MPAEVPLTEAHRAYLRAFDDWLLFPSESTLERRRNALELMLIEADVAPAERPDLASDFERLAAELEHMVGRLRALAARARSVEPRRGRRPW